MKNCSSPQIKDPTELIERLKQNPNVLGILQYGTAMCPQGADTDLCVVVSERPEGLESIHFWIGNGPVDLNIRTLDELLHCTVDPQFDEVLRAGKVLYERESGLLANLSATPAVKPSLPKPAAPAFMRHGHAHYLHKIDHYKDRDPLLCNVLLCGAVHWLLHAYVSVRGLPYRGEKSVLKAMAADDAALLADLESASGSAPLAERIEALRRFTERVLAPVGGPWQEGEVLFFTEPGKDARPTNDWHDFFAALLQSADRT